MRVRVARRGDRPRRLTGASPSRPSTPRRPNSRPGNGELIRHEPLRLGLSLPGLGGRRLPGTATRLMYTSTDSNGEPVAVTGAYIEPSARWKGAGPRPLAVVGSGTMGQGDQCAPSSPWSAR
ncbi:hypothetical protein SALBM217S_07638 [Streptomyces griseoloalbus]